VDRHGLKDEMVAKAASPASGLEMQERLGMVVGGRGGQCAFR
jgi:hypothetical protein